MKVVSCMGGWCRVRESCAHYHARSESPAERLCGPGKDEPVRMVDEVRFAAWIAGATAERVEKWKETQ